MTPVDTVMNAERKRKDKRKSITIDDPIIPGWRNVSGAAGRSTAQLKRDVKAGRFPAPIHLGEHQVGWRKSWIEAWIESRPRRYSTA
jgi:predicted DNA-binding transcriptional regulator AlpA